MFWEEANHCYQLVGAPMILNNDNWTNCFKDPMNQQYHTGSFLRETVAHSAKAAEIWRDLNQQLKSILHLRRTNEGSKITRRNIGRDFSIAVLKLEHDLEMYLSEPVSRLKYGFFSSPPIRQLLPKGSLDYRRIVQGRCPDLDIVEDASIKELFWIMTALWDDDQRKLAGVGYLRTS